MAASDPQTVVFVHGWSVTHTDTYGGLPERVRAEARKSGIDIEVREIFLSEYVSFRDEVRLEDISRAFQAAVGRELGAVVADGRRFACITHSTGGPVVRDWWHRYYLSRPRSGRCPMSHLIMLAPANFGSALAQLGASRLSRIAGWFQGVEPGTGVLDWLELGSPDAWELNEEWIRTDAQVIGPTGIFPFVLTGQSIDRKLYDHLNSYTGESGSDGVVRVAAANLNSSYIVLRQEEPAAAGGDAFAADQLILARGQAATARAPATAFRIVPGASHSGNAMGIMASVAAGAGGRGEATAELILRCLAVNTRPAYQKLTDAFAAETDEVQRAERIEKQDVLFKRDREFIHDRYAMVVFRLRDEKGYPIEDADLVLTAGKNHDPNHLPPGFFVDRQRNQRHKGTITYYFNYDVMAGTDAVVDEKGRELRPALRGADMLGLKVRPRPNEGFVHYLDCEIQASRAVLANVLKPNETTLVDIELRRVVHEGVFRIKRGPRRESFKRTKPGPPIE